VAGSSYEAGFQGLEVTAHVDLTVYQKTYLREIQGIYLNCKSAITKDTLYASWFVV